MKEKADNLNDKVNEATATSNEEKKKLNGDL